MEKELTRFTIDFEALVSFKDSDNDDLPICSFMKVYDQIGMYKFIEQYYQDNNLEKGTFSYVDNVFANPNTIMKIRKLVVDNWETYDINIDRDQHVFWKPNSNYGKDQHYHKKLSKLARGAVDRDFLDCCPGADPTIPENTIVLRIIEDDVIDAEVTQA